MIRSSPRLADLKWSHPSDLNRRPFDYESNALPTELGWPVLLAEAELQNILFQKMLVKADGIRGFYGLHGAIFVLTFGSIYPTSVAESLWKNNFKIA